jgi:hypothetical protein
MGFVLHFLAQKNASVTVSYARRLAHPYLCSTILRVRALFGLLLAPLSVVACGLSLSNGPAAGSDAAAPMPMPSRTTTSMPDASPTPDATAPTEPPKPMCGPPDENLVAPFPVRKRASTAPMVIDGLPTEWAGVEWHTIEKPYGPNPERRSPPPCAQFAATWDKQYLYVIVQVADADAPKPIEPKDIWSNDAVELFWAGDRRPDGIYTKESHQLVVDRHGTGFHKVGSADPPNTIANDNYGFSSADAITFAHRVTSWGYIVEARLAARTLGEEMFEVSDLAGFNAAFDNGTRSNGVTTDKDYYYWQLNRAESIACATGLSNAVRMGGGYCCAGGLVGETIGAYCNTKMFAEITLAE